VQDQRRARASATAMFSAVTSVGCSGVSAAAAAARNLLRRSPPAAPPPRADPGRAARAS
jgi:hypothetical protein